MFNRQIKQENHRLKEELQHLHHIHRHLDDEMMMSILSKSGHIESVNRQFCDETGYSEEQLVGKALLDFVPDAANQTPHYKKLRETLRHEQHYVGIIQFVKENGEMDVHAPMQYPNHLQVGDHKHHEHSTLSNLAK